MLHYVSFSAEINPSTTENLIAAMTNLHNSGATEVHLLLSTPGGSIMNGFNIYNVLRSLPTKLVVYNVGNVDSIGNVIFLAATERYASPCSTFMFHGAGFESGAGVRLDDQFLREKLDNLTQEHRRMGTVLEKHTALQSGDVVELFKQATTKDVDWALSVRMIQAVREPKVPFGVPVHSLVFNR